jgi:hypothetical protein
MEYPPQQSKPQAAFSGNAQPALSFPTASHVMLRLRLEQVGADAHSSMQDKPETANQRRNG